MTGWCVHERNGLAQRRKDAKERKHRDTEATERTFPPGSVPSVPLCFTIGAVFCLHEHELWSAKLFSHKKPQRSPRLCESPPRFREESGLAQRRKGAKKQKHRDTEATEMSGVLLAAGGFVTGCSFDRSANR